MRHHPVRRLAAVLVNLLFLLAWGEPVALHPCPMHDGVAVHATAAGQSAPATHHGHAMAPAAGHEQHASHPAGHVCSCLGNCAISVGVVAPTAQAIRWQVVVSRRTEPSHDEPVAPRAAADRLLPFANGPPRSA